MHESDVLIIGAGPAGSVAANMLARRGFSVTVLERSHFPRFSIGESLLPQSMEFLDTAGLLPAARAAGFQYKNGAIVYANPRDTTTFDFRDKSCSGWNDTWQVERARFDKALADAASATGAQVRFGETITAIAINADESVLDTVDADGTTRQYRARFTLDASGAGRVLARHMSLVLPTQAPPRTALFTHVADHITTPDYDRCKILIGIHPEHQDVWYWLIPFRARASVGVVGPVEKILETGDELAALQGWIGAMPRFATLLADAQWDDKIRRIRGYAAEVSQLHGPGFALLGNAGGFLDPVFSSGVTVAMKSAVLASNLLIRQLDGETVDWDAGFERPLRAGYSVFRGFVDAWYRGDLQKIFFAREQRQSVRRQLCSILAGYVWNTDNPYTHRTDNRLRALAQHCS